MAHQRRRRSTVMVHAERQRDVEMPERPLEQVGQIFGDEIGVFEKTEHCQIGDDCSRDEARALGRQISACGEKVHRDRKGQKTNKRQVPVAVKDERQDDENANSPLRMRIDEAVDNEAGRQKHQQERIVVE